MTAATQPRISAAVTIRTESTTTVASTSKSLVTHVNVAQKRVRTKNENGAFTTIPQKKGWKEQEHSFHRLKSCACALITLLLRAAQ